MREILPNRTDSFEVRVDEHGNVNATRIVGRVQYDVRSATFGTAGSALLATLTPSPWLLVKRAAIIWLRGALLR